MTHSSSLRKSAEVKSVHLSTSTLCHQQFFGANKKNRTLQNRMSSSSSLPIVDLSLPDAQAAAQLGKACRTIGFFIIINHGIPLPLIRSVFSDSKQLFENMSQELKSKHAIRSDNRGYSSFSTEKLDPSSTQKDNKECYNFVPDSGFDHFRRPAKTLEEAIGLLDDGENEEKNKIKNEFLFRWPQPEEGAPEDLRPVMMSYMSEVMKVSDRLHRLIAIDLKLENPETFFASCFENPMATLRLLRYPGESEVEVEANKQQKSEESTVTSSSSSSSEQKISAGKHTDYDSLTFLVVDGTAGLQVQHRETNEWLDAPTFPKENLGEAIIVNIADLLMRWSNDVYKSTPHRVLQPKTERYSCALFVGPAPETKISALPGTGEPKYEETTAIDHLMMKLSATYKF